MTVDTTSASLYDSLPVLDSWYNKPKQPPCPKSSNARRRSYQKALKRVSGQYHAVDPNHKYGSRSAGIRPAVSFSSEPPKVYTIPPQSHDEKKHGQHRASRSTSLGVKLLVKHFWQGKRKHSK